MEGSAAIQLNGICKIFGPDPARALALVERGMDREAVLQACGHVVGLYNINLDIFSGELFVIMGLSGSGKSTLIRHLNRLIEPTAGAVMVGNRNVIDMDESELRAFRARRISMVFQHFGLLPHRTVLDNVAYGLRIRGRSRKEARAGAQRWVERVGLGGFETRFPHELSGGMQQRVGLARALATDADILLMDEAFSALDPIIRDDMQTLLIDLQRTLKKTIVFITHDLDEALRLGDRVAILNQGKVEQVGTPTELLAEQTNEFVQSFVRKVNRFDVLTVGDIMHPVAAYTEKSMGDGAIRIHFETNAAQYVSLVSDAWEPLAWVYRRDALSGGNIAVNRVDRVPTVSSGTSLGQAIAVVLRATSPVAVLDDDGRLAGALDGNVLARAIQGDRPGCAGQVCRGPVRRVA